MSVFTAPARRARSLSWLHRATARSLCGSVTLAPRPPTVAKALMALAKSAGLASMATYSIAMPCCFANAAWMRGDSECATGCPKTA